MPERLVVVGGNAAGMSAAAQARRLRGPEELRITAFEAGTYTSYSACGIPYWIGGLVEGPDALVARSPATFREHGIDVRTRHSVTALDVDGHGVTVLDEESGRVFEEPYDHLVIATGSVPTTPEVLGVDAAGVYGVQRLDDGSHLLSELAAEGTRRVVVVGSGYIGLEIAEAAVRRGLDVTVVDRAATPLQTFDPDVGEAVAAAMRGLGIRVVLGDAVDALDVGEAGRVTAVRTASGRVLAADVVVVGLGVRPDVALAVEAGVPLGPSGGIAVDRRMRTGVPGVWAAGDCVESPHRVSGRPVVIALGTHANKQGRVAGINIAGGYATFPGVLGTAATKICKLEVARTGLSERECAQAGFDVVTATVTATTRAGYLPGAKEMTVKLVAERRTGRLLGGQLTGAEGVGKRIDVLATAIWAGMSAEDLVGLDLAYAPPFGPVWDPVQTAARRVLAGLSEV